MCAQCYFMSFCNVDILSLSLFPLPCHYIQNPGFPLNFIFCWCYGMCNMCELKGPELLSKYIGASEKAVRDIFTR